MSEAKGHASTARKRRRTAGTVPAPLTQEAMCKRPQSIPRLVAQAMLAPSDTAAVASAAAPGKDSLGTSGSGGRGADGKAHQRHPPAEAAMYSSRQQALFKEHAEVVAEPAAKQMSISDITVYRVPRLHDRFDDIPSLPNYFVRTKLAGLKDQESNPQHDLVGQQVSQHRRRVSGTTLQGAAATGAPAGMTSHATAYSAAECVTIPTYGRMIHDDEIVLADIVRHPDAPPTAKAFVRGGPRALCAFPPGKVIAAIVTCGGLCPGLNDVIDSLFETLYYNYGVDTVYGIRNGMRGFWDPSCLPWVKLSPQFVTGIHREGGSVLGSSRGMFDGDRIIDALSAHGVNQLYIVGGDGTHRAALALHKLCAERKLRIAVVGIPKTVDNDIGMIDRSFGFNTAVARARDAIESANVEARCSPLGIGIVKLMGRHSGYIAAHASLATRDVDLCLLPEVDFELDGPNGCLVHIHNILRARGHCIIVVAEGAGTHLTDVGLKSVDASGNPALPKIGTYLQDRICSYFKERHVDVSVKYHNPQYLIRSVPADAADSVYCLVLAQNAVHGAMAGFEAFSSCVVNNRSVLIPFTLINSTSPSYLNPRGRTWERLLGVTHQPVPRKRRSNI